MKKQQLRLHACSMRACVRKRVCVWVAWCKCCIVVVMVARTVSHCHIQTHTRKGNQHIVHLTASAHQMFNEFIEFHSKKRCSSRQFKMTHFYDGSQSYHCATIEMISPQGMNCKFTKIHCNPNQRRNALKIAYWSILLKCSLTSKGQQVSFFIYKKSINKENTYSTLRLCQTYNNKAFCITFLAF